MVWLDDHSSWKSQTLLGQIIEFRLLNYVVLVLSIRYTLSLERCWKVQVELGSFSGCHMCAGSKSC